MLLGLLTVLFVCLKVIAVAFVVIDLPWERGCPGDYLEVYDGTEMVGFHIAVWFKWYILR